MLLLIIRVAGDEASAVITVARFAGWTGQKLQSLIESVVGTVFGGTGLIAAVAFLLTGLMSRGVLDSLLYAGATLAGAIAASILIVSLTTSLTANLLIACSFAFGLDAPFAILACEMTVEDAPAGVWPLHHLSFSESEGYFQLAHTTTYADPRTPRIIADWLLGIGSNAGVATARQQGGGRPVSERTF